MRIRPDRDEFRALGGRAHGGAGVDRAARRPGDAGRGLRQARRRRRRVPARVGRARRTVEPVQLRRPRPGGHAGAARRRSITRRRRRARRPADSTGASSPPSTHLLATYRAPIIPDLPPLQGGVMGFLGYDVVREVEHLPDVPHDDRQLPDAVMSIIGSLAAFDHWRQRVYLIESVPVLGLDGRASSTRPTTRRSRGSTRRSPTSPGRCRTCRSPRRSPATSCPRCASSMPQRHVPARRRGGQGAHRRGRHLPGRAGAALRHRARRRPVRLLPRAAPGEPEPVHVLPPPPGRSRSSAARPSRWCRCSAAR